MPNTPQQKQKKSNINDNNHNQQPPTTKRKNKKRGKEKLVVYISRKQNKSFPNSLNDNLTSFQTNIWKEKVFTSQNVISLSESTLQEKNEFYQNMMKETFGNHVIVNKYNEKDEKFEILKCDEVLQYLKNTFKKKIHQHRITLKQKPDQDFTEIVTKSNRRKTIKSSALQRMEYIPDFLDFYTNDEVAPTVLSSEWHMWSMIHSMFESFDLIVYNGSHKIDENQETHLASRCNLKFPQEPNMFILFHGNLVHSGAKAKPEPGKNSLNYACDLRAFFYISKFDTKRKRAARMDNTSGIKLRDNHADDPSLGTTYVGCPKMTNLFAKCEKCERYQRCEKAKYLTSNGFEIDLKELYNEYKTKKKRKVISSNLLLEICLPMDGQFMRE